MTSGIEVSRPKGKGFRRDMLRRYKILVDDVEVASLKEGESAAIDVPLGPHAIKAKIDWAVTAPLEVVCGEDGVVRLIVRPGGTRERG